MKNRNNLRLSFAENAVLAGAWMMAVVGPILVGMMETPAVRAQTQAAAKASALPRFEVAAIKATNSYSPAVTFRSAGYVSLGGDSLMGLIRYAYDAGIGSNQEITGGPGWIDRERYSVEAKAEGNPSVAEYQLMLRALLEERFALKIHTVPKTVDVYALVLARSDGKLGPKVQPFPGECGVLGPPAGFASKQGTSKQTGAKQPAGEAPYRPLTDASAPPLGCKVYVGGPNGIKLEGAPMAFLARMLSTQTAVLGRPVVDRTGLSGRYNIQLDLEFPTPARPNGEAQPADLFTPSLADALEKQLGLKLEASKGTVENIVVDSAERPSEN